VAPAAPAAAAVVPAATPTTTTGVTVLPAKAVPLVSARQQFYLAELDFLHCDPPATLPSDRELNAAGELLGLSERTLYYVLTEEGESHLKLRGRLTEWVTGILTTKDLGSAFAEGGAHGNGQLTEPRSLTRVAGERDQVQRMRRGPFGMYTMPLVGDPHGEDCDHMAAAGYTNRRAIMCNSGLLAYMLDHGDFRAEAWSPVAGFKAMHQTAMFAVAHTYKYPGVKDPYARLARFYRETPATVDIILDTILYTGNARVSHHMRALAVTPTGYGTQERAILGKGKKALRRKAPAAVPVFPSASPSPGV